MGLKNSLFLVIVVAEAVISNGFLDPVSSGIGSFTWEAFKHNYSFSLSQKGSIEYEVLQGYCSSKLYCRGQLLNVIQMSGIFPDSKTFVDMPTSRPESEVIARFEAISDKSNISALKQFIRENFLEPGFEVQSISPDDWKPNIQLLFDKTIILDDRLVQLAKVVHAKWKTLTRRFDKSRLCKGCVVSSLNAPFPFVVPGGRFREFYYWDSYWIVEGLLISEMFETALGHIMNMVEAVNTFGFVPNGFRVYYLNRSQPPLLTHIIGMYLERLGNNDLLNKVLPALDREYAFWMKERSVVISDCRGRRNYTLNLYRVKNNAPRPESYKEDFDIAHSISHENKIHHLYYCNIASGAESGWDFTSRWLRHENSLKSIDLMNIVPVDLNSIMSENERLLSLFHAKTGNASMSNYYKKQQMKRIEAIHEILWDDQRQLWLDYNLTSQQGSNGGQSFHISNLAPLWFASHKKDIKLNKKTVYRILKRFEGILLSYAGGVPASLVFSQQQWDFPNSWAPLEYFMDKMYENLREVGVDFDVSAFGTETPTRIEVAHRHTVQRWINSIYCGWQMNGTFYEKYDVTRMGHSGYGGEYTVQDGFGWTNGVILYYLEKHGSWLKAPNQC